MEAEVSTKTLVNKTLHVFTTYKTAALIIIINYVQGLGRRTLFRTATWTFARSADIPRFSLSIHRNLFLMAEILPYKYPFQVYLQFIILWQQIFGPLLWSSGQSSWLHAQRSWVQFPALPQFLRSSGYKDEIGGECSTNWEKRNAYRILVGETEGKRRLERPRRRPVDNIKMGLRETGIGRDGVDLIDMAQDSDQWRALVGAVLNLRVP
jgi:hypothetical protein